MRDLQDYSNRYMAGGFEHYQVRYRRKHLLERMERVGPKKVLEIGCGMEPLFSYVKDAEFVIVEPSDSFYRHACGLVNEKDEKRITLVQAMFEEAAPGLPRDFDMIVCSGLLHEVEKPELLLQAMAQVCNKDTIMDINVPNARSIHRLIAKGAGLICDVSELSEQNRALQQNTVFTADSLCEMIRRNGMEIMETGSYFVKPFTHGQMARMMEEGIIDEKILDGLDWIGNMMPELGSEIYVQCKVRQL